MYGLKMVFVYDTGKSVSYCFVGLPSKIAIKILSDLKADRSSFVLVRVCDDEY